MPPGHIPSFLFGNLITSVGYGKLKSYLARCSLHYYFHRNCRYALPQLCEHNTAEAKNYRVVKSTTRYTIGLDFHFRDRGEFDVAPRSDLFRRLLRQNIIGLWINIYMAFVVHGSNPEAYLGLIRTPAKTIIQTGQLGAILLADALVVRPFPVHADILNLSNLYRKVYRTWVLWNHSYFVIAIPCLTFVATFREFQDLWSAAVV